MGIENEEANLDQTPAGENLASEPESRRDAIEAAFEKAESTEASGEVGTAAASDASIPGTTKPVSASEKPVDGEKPGATDDKPLDISDKAPAGWKPTTKAKWATVDPEVRAEVIRREREAAQVLTNSDGARKFAGAVANAAEPFRARLAAQGVDIPTAVHALLRSDYTLATGTQQQRAALVAKMIKDYGVDVNELDAALSGQVVSPQDQSEQRFAAMLDQRLAPVNQFLQGTARQQQQAEQQETERLITEVDAMEAHPEKYPYFGTVREDMADIIEMSAKKGVYLTTEQAYNKACLVHPEVSERVIAQRTQDAARVAAVARDARARKALGASKSVSGNPAGVQTRFAPAATDRRGTILAAIEAHEGR